MVSTLENFKNEDENYPDNTLQVSTKVYPDINRDCQLDQLFHVKFRFGDLTNVNILQKIKLRIKDELENEHYIFF